MAEATEVGYYKLLLEVALPNMVRHTEACLPHEAVGIITNNGSVYPLINQRRSEREFVVSKLLVEEALTQLHSRDLVGVALYHSHPTRSAIPSEQDITMMQQTPETVFVIQARDFVVAYTCDDSQGEPRVVAKLEVPVG